MSESPDSDPAHASLRLDPTTPALNDLSLVETPPATPETSSTDADTPAHAYTPPPTQETTMGNQQSGEGSLRRRSKKKSKNKEEKGKIGIASALFNDPILGASHMGGSPVDEAAATPSKRKRQIEQTKSPRPIRSTYDNVNQTGSIPSLCDASEMYTSDLFLDTVSRLDVTMTPSQAEFRQHVDPQTLDNLSYGGSSIPESGFITPALATPQVQRNQLAGAMTTSDSVTELGKEIERTIFERLSANQKAGKAEAQKEPSIPSSPKLKEVKMTLVMGSPIPPRKAVTEVKLAPAGPRTAKLEIIDGQTDNLDSISTSSEMTPPSLKPVIESKIEIDFRAEQRDEKNVSAVDMHDGTDKADSELMEKDCNQKERDKDVLKMADPSPTRKRQIQTKAKPAQVHLKSSNSDESFSDFEKVKLHIEEEDPLARGHKKALTSTRVHVKKPSPQSKNDDQDSGIKEPQSDPNPCGDLKKSSPQSKNVDQDSEIKEPQTDPKHFGDLKKPSPQSQNVDQDSEIKEPQTAPNPTSGVDAAGQQSALDKKPRQRPEKATEKNLVESTRKEIKEKKEDREITREISGRIRKKREWVKIPDDGQEQKDEDQHQEIVEALSRSQAIMTQGSAARTKPAVGTLDAERTDEDNSLTETPEPIGKSKKKAEEGHQEKIETSVSLSRSEVIPAESSEETASKVVVSAAAAATKPSESAARPADVPRPDEGDSFIETPEPACEQLVHATEFVCVEQAQVVRRRPVLHSDRGVRFNQGWTDTKETEEKSAKTEAEINDGMAGNFETKMEEVIGPEVEKGKTEKERDKRISSASPNKENVIVEAASPYKQDTIVESTSPYKQDMISEAASPYKQDINVEAASPYKQNIIESTSPYKQEIIVKPASPDKQDTIVEVASPYKQNIIESTSPYKQEIIAEAASPDKENTIAEADRQPKVIKPSLLTDEGGESNSNASENPGPTKMEECQPGETVTTKPSSEETGKTKKKKKDKKKRRRKGKQKSADAEDTTRIEPETPPEIDNDNISSKTQDGVTTSSREEDTEKSAADESGDSSGNNAFEKNTLQHQTTIIERTNYKKDCDGGSNEKPIDVCDLLLQSNEFKNQDPCSAGAPKKGSNEKEENPTVLVETNLKSQDPHSAGAHEKGSNEKEENPTVLVETNLTVNSLVSPEVLSDEPTPTNDRPNELRAFYMPDKTQPNRAKLFCLAGNDSLQEKPFGVQTSIVSNDGFPQTGDTETEAGQRTKEEACIERKEEQTKDPSRKHLEEQQHHGGDGNAADVTKALEKGGEQKEDYKRNVRISLTSEEVSGIFENSKTGFLDENLIGGKESSSLNIGHEDNLKGKMNRSDGKEEEEEEEEEDEEEEEEKQKETEDKKKQTKKISNLTLSEIDSSLPETLPELADLQNFLEYIKIGEQPVGVETPPFSPRAENGRSSSPNENSNSRRLSRISPAVTERSVTESDLDISEQRDDLSTDSNIFADDEDESSSELLFTKTYTEPDQGGEVCVSCTVVNTNADDDDSDEFWAESSATEEVYRKIETSTKAVTTVFDNARLQMQDIHTHLHNLRLQMERLQDSLDSASVRSQEYYSMDNDHVTSQEFYPLEKGLLVSQEYFSKRRKVPVTTEECSPVDIGPVLTEEYYSSTLGKPPLS